MRPNWRWGAIYIVGDQCLPLFRVTSGNQAHLSLRLPAFARVDLRCEYVGALRASIDAPLWALVMHRRCRLLAAVDFGVVS